MPRIAAVGDIHIGADSVGMLAPHLASIDADVLLLAGDLTRIGEPDEAAVVAKELQSSDVPVVAVLGNHDYHCGGEAHIRETLEGTGVRVLEGETATIETSSGTVGIAGIKGFGGGFPGACGSDFGEPEMKAFIGHTKEMAARLERALASLETDVRIVLLHYAPVADTLEGERLEIYPFLGSYLLAEPVDKLGADLVLHGHVHGGTERGTTPGGIPVRNVAQHVIGRAFALYDVHPVEVAARG